MFSLGLGATPTHIRVAITRPNASSAPPILVVGDESDLSLLLAYTLEAEGYVAESVERGDEAELRLAESAPDLIILDWMLPGAACSSSAPAVSASSQRSSSAGDVALGVNWRDNRIALRRPESRRADTRHYPRPLGDPVLRQHA